MSPLAFATLSPQQRTDGADLSNLMRNIGSAVGVALTTVILTDHLQMLHNQRVANASPFNRALSVDDESLAMNPQIPFGLANLNSLIECPAQVQAYANVFPFMFLVSLPVFLVTWLMKRPVFAAGATPNIEVVE